jgi:hypothetical protein
MATQRTRIVASFGTAVVLAGLGVLSTAAPPTGPAEVTIPVEQFERLHALIKPQPGESKWAQIPWMTDLAAARHTGAAEDKPLFVWRPGGGEVLGRA